MPTDERDDASQKSVPGSEKESVSGALQSETDRPLPPEAERIAERDADRPEPITPQGRRRRYLSRRNALIATLGIAVIAVALALIGFLAYKLGYADRFIAGQIKDTLAAYGIRAEFQGFSTKLGTRTVVITNIGLYDQKTGSQIGRIDRLVAVVRITDLYKLNLRRHINLESMEISGLEAWVKFDQNGVSNLSNLRMPPPDENSRILFDYSTGRIQLDGALIHFGDELHHLSGEGRNLRATVEPEDPSQPVASRSNAVAFAASNSTFTYDGNPVDNIDLEAHAHINAGGAQIDDLMLRSPLAEAHLQGTLTDWQAMRYQMQINSTVDLMQVANVFQTGDSKVSVRGVGNFTGTVSGEGAKYQLDGGIKSDAIAADNVRLKALNVTARGSGDGSSYDINGRAVAELLTAGDFQLNAVQLAGGVMGTGSDFRWVGDLRAAAARGAGTTIAGLILADVSAEMRDGALTASAPKITVNSLSTSAARVSGAQISDVRVRYDKGVATASAGSVQAGAILASGARVNGVAARRVDVTERDGMTSVTTDGLRVGGINAAGATIGSINIGGVRLSIHDGRVEGSSADINAGTVTVARSGSFAGGRIDGVRLAHPVFTLEPSGRYRASADLSLGGGVLADVNLGAARAAVVATNNQVQLNNLNASVLNGRAAGNVTVNTGRGASRLAASFNDLDVGKLLSIFSGHAVPVAGKATGAVDLSFPGLNAAQASGSARADFTGETGSDAGGRTPLTGSVALRAAGGVFNIDRANLRTAASELTAAGQFSIVRSESNLQVNLSSTDAGELQDIVASSGLVPELGDQLDSNGIRLGGKLAFNGTVRGKLADPEFSGRASLDSLLVNQRDLGSLSATINATPARIQVTDGRLAQPDGGGIQFSLNAARTGTNNTALDATLNNVDVGNLVAALSSVGASKNSSLASLARVDVRSKLSGRINVTGLPDAMSGTADLRFGAGSINGQSFDSIVARASFNGPVVDVTTVDARFNAGSLTASGTVNAETKAFDLQARATGIRLDLLGSLAAAGSAPQLAGTADLTARASGILTDFSSYQINFNGEGHDVVVNGRPAGTLSLIGQTENKQLNIRFTTGLLGQPQVVAASIDLSNDKLPATIETTLTGADLSPLFAALLPTSDIKVRGRATGTLKASGDLRTEDAAGEDVFGLAGLSGTANFTELTLQVEDIQLSAVSPLVVRLASNEVIFEKAQFTGPGTNFAIGGRAAIAPGGAQDLTVDGRLNLRVLSSLSPDVFPSGTAELAMRIRGTYEQPSLNGTLSVTGASLSTLVGAERLQLANVQGLIRFNSNLAEVQSLTGTLGGGHITASGGVQLAGFVPTRYRLIVHGENIVVPFPQDFRSTADADIEINGSTRGATAGQFISGSVNLRRAEYTQNIDLADLINRRPEASLTEGGGGGTSDSSLVSTTHIDLVVDGRDALVVHNNLADLVGSVALRISGTADSPVISGRVTVTRGTLTFRNDRYELTRAFIDLPGQAGADPVLNIQAESEIKGYRIIVSLTGPLSQPSATVRSDPALPQADVVSLITTGSLSPDTGSLAQTGVGTAATLLTDVLINAPAQRATSRLFGLNRFAIDPVLGSTGQSPTARLTVGRQINKNLSVTYATNVGPDPNQVLALEYQVSNRLSFIAQYEQGSTRTLTNRNNNFSFEIRFRKRF